MQTDSDAHIPCDYRIYDKPEDGKTENEHFRDMLYKAKFKGFEPECILFDNWYAGLDNLKLIRNLGWYWQTRLEYNRLISTCAKVIAHFNFLSYCFYSVYFSKIYALVLKSGWKREYRSISS